MIEQMVNQLKEEQVDGMDSMFDFSLIEHREPLKKYVSPAVCPANEEAIQEVAALARRHKLAHLCSFRFLVALSGLLAEVRNESSLPRRV